NTCRARSSRIRSVPNGTVCLEEDRRENVIARQLQDLLISFHGIVRRSGLIETSAGSMVFRSLYMVYKRYEDHLREFLCRNPGVVRGGNVLDIGANVGYTAAVLARAVDPGRLVHAFEPEPANFRMLQQTAAAAEFGGRIVAHRCAVGEEEGN